MNRLKQLRLARSLSLDALVAAIDGAVTKQALSKYENDLIRPSPSVAARLAHALGVKPASLWSAPATEVEFLAYRKKASLGRKEASHIEARIAHEFERRVHLQERCWGELRLDVPVRAFKVETDADAEEAAMKLRAKWSLGLDPIGDVVGLLETHLIHVIEINTSEDFDGLSALARRDQMGRVAAAVVSRGNVPGDRQRLSLIHELAHVVMNVPKGADEERLAFRFAGAFLIPSSALQRELGSKRTSLDLAELVILKQYFKVSIQALVKRAFDLDIISEPAYRAAFSYIAKMGWRKVEPEPIAREKSRWMEQTVLRGVAEGLISTQEGHGYIGDSVPLDHGSGLMRRKEFLSLAPAKRHAQMRAHARKLGKYYETSEWSALDTEGVHEPA